MKANAPKRKVFQDAVDLLGMPEAENAQVLKAGGLRCRRSDRSVQADDFLQRSTAPQR